MAWYFFGPDNVGHSRSSSCAAMVGSLQNLTKISSLSVLSIPAAFLMGSLLYYSSAFTVSVREKNISSVFSVKKSVKSLPVHIVPQASTFQSQNGDMETLAH